jgi:ABC-2 type transport system ATP-binding protein
VIVDHGRVVAAGSPAELKARAGRNVIEVHTRDRADLHRAAAGLAALDHERPQIEEATHLVRVAVGTGSAPLRDALGALDAAGVAVDDISLRPPTLDEVFLALTGQAIDEPAGHPAA